MNVCRIFRFEPKVFILFISFLIAFAGSSQSTEVSFDYPLFNLDAAISEDERAYLVSPMFNEARLISVDYTEILLDSALKFAEHYNFQFVEARLNMVLAELYRIKNREDLMLEYYMKASDYYKEFMVLYPDSLKRLMAHSISGVYNNMADVYVSREQYQEALDLYYFSLNSILGFQDSLQESVRYSNISITYVYLKEADSAMKYSLLCFDLEKEMNTFDGLSYAHRGLADVYSLKRDYNKTMLEIDSAVSYANLSEDSFLIVDMQSSKAKMLYEFEEWEKSKEVFEKVERLSLKLGYVQEIENSYFNLKLLNEKLGDYQQAFKYSDLLYKLLEESLEQNINVQSEAKALEFSAQYQTTIKDAEIENLNKQKELDAEINKGIQDKRALEDRRTRTLNYSMIGGLILLSIIGVILYVNARKRMRLNGELRASHKDLSEKHKLVKVQANEIGDSIAYAKNIQGAILPNESEFGVIGEDRFVLFSPKDVVSGDFYWTFKSERLDLKYLAVADCTGHGVPGAFMSILGISLLDKIVIKLTDLSTGNILKELNYELHKNLSSGGQSGVRDGMDIALISINENTNQVVFSGVRNSVVFVSGGIVKEYKGERFDLGRSSESKYFQEITIDYSKGDMIYMFSDGYVDQKGGTDGKKLFMQPFRELLKEISALPVAKQEEILNLRFQEWKGDEFEQMDDVLVTGIRL